MWQLERGLCSLQLEKARTQPRRPSTAKKKIIICFFENLKSKLDCYMYKWHRTIVICSWEMNLASGVGGNVHHPGRPIKWASWMSSVGAHVVSALLQKGLGVKVWAAEIWVGIPVRDHVCVICSRQSQAFRKRVHMCDQMNRPWACYNYSFSKFMKSSCGQHGFRHWTYNDV